MQDPRFFVNARGWLVRISKETHWRRRAHQDQLLHVLEEFEDLLDKVRNPLERHDACPARDPRCESVTKNARAGMSGDTARKLQALRAQGPLVTDQDGCSLRIAER